MNQYQQKIERFMDGQIGELKEGLSHLKDSDISPTDLGDVYNGMLRHTVEFEIEHMECLKKELLEELQ
mgnify:FL=1